MVCHSIYRFFTASRSNPWVKQCRTVRNKKNKNSFIPSYTYYYVRCSDANVHYLTIRYPPSVRYNVLRGKIDTEKNRAIYEKYIGTTSIKTTAS